MFCVNRVGIKKISIETEKLEKVYDETVNLSSRIDTDGNIICYTCPDEDAVNVLDSGYPVIYTFGNDTILSYIRGISMDHQQNMFVCNSNNNNLLLISNDGEKCEIVVVKIKG